MKGFFKVLLGLGIGAAIGMLFAPKSGKELRGQLMGTAGRKTLPAAPSWEPGSEGEADWAIAPQAAPEWPTAVAVEELDVGAAAVVDAEAVAEVEAIGEAEAEAEVVIEETVVREDRVITTAGVVEDIVTVEERLIAPDGEVLEETVVQEDSVAIVDAEAADEAAATEETAVDDLRARIEATRAEVETSLAAPFGGPALAEDIGEAGPADRSLADEALGGETYVAETAIGETAAVSDDGPVVQEMAVVEETVVEDEGVTGIATEEVVTEDVVVAETAEGDVIIEETTTRVTVVEEEPSSAAEVLEGAEREPVLLWPEAEPTAPEPLEAVEAPAATEQGADDAGPFETQPETRRAWDMWSEEEVGQPEAPVTDAAAIESDQAGAEESAVVAYDAASPPEESAVWASEPPVVSEPVWGAAATPAPAWEDAPPVTDATETAAGEETTFAPPVGPAVAEPAAVDETPDAEAVQTVVREEPPVAGGAAAQAGPAPEWPAAPAMAETVIEAAPLGEPAPDGAAAPASPAEPGFESAPPPEPALAPEPQAAAPAAAAEAVVAEPVETSPRDTGAIDQAEMRRRIEETRARLKAKAFDAMMSGEAALLGRDDDGAVPRPDDVKLDGDVESTIDESLSQEDY